MNKFTEDVQLVGEMQALITEAEKTANMSPTTQMMLKMAVPKAKDYIPEAKQKAARQIDVLTRAKARLVELMDIAYGKEDTE